MARARQTATRRSRGDGRSTALLGGKTDAAASRTRCAPCAVRPCARERERLREDARAWTQPAPSRETRLRPGLIGLH